MKFILSTGQVKNLLFFNLSFFHISFIPNHCCFHRSILAVNLVLVSSGLLITQTADYGTEEKLIFEEQSENSNLIRLYRTVHTTNDGQYQLTVKTSISKTLYARGFVVYLDTKTGEIITLYTDVRQVNS